MKISQTVCRFAASCAMGFCLAGCSILFPSKGITPRTFVLTPVPTGPEMPPVSTNLVVGIRQVKVPGYLSTRSFAVRKDNNEIDYPESLQWAERLDGALQQVLGEDLSALIPTDQVRYSMWDAEAVAVQIDVNVARFDVDSQGEAVLVAWWRVLSPSGAVISSGRFSGTRKGQSPQTNPGNAVFSMSRLTTDLAKKLAQEIKNARMPERE
jgi:uncharacterized lipoprotein YmbA